MGHEAVFVQSLGTVSRRGRDVLAVLFFTLQGRSEKCDAPPVPTKIGVQERGGDPGTLWWVNMAGLLHSLSLENFLPAQHTGLLAPELQGSADT